MHLFSYKLTHDSGFAPNPFGQTLTLATCKPQIRRRKSVNDWIAGFTSRTLAGHDVGSERLIYLMRVAEKLHMRDYFADSRFQDEVPDMSAEGPMAKAGDNIYRPLRPDAESWADFEQLPRRLPQSDSSRRHHAFPSDTGQDFPHRLPGDRATGH